MQKIKRKVIKQGLCRFLSYKSITSSESLNHCCETCLVRQVAKTIITRIIYYTKRFNNCNEIIFKILEPTINKLFKNINCVHITCDKHFQLYHLLENVYGFHLRKNNIFIYW